MSADLMGKYNLLITQSARLLWPSKDVPQDLPQITAEEWFFFCDQLIAGGELPEQLQDNLIRRRKMMVKEFPRASEMEQYLTLIAA